MCIVVGKVTYARTGIIVNVTPIESEFFGQLLLNFQILLHFQQKFMQMKEWLNSYF